MKGLFKLLVYTLSILVTAYILPGVHVDGFLIAFIVAIVLAVLNILVKPVLVILTIPVTVFTFGLFLLVINALMIALADVLVSGFEVNNFWWALLFSIIVSIVNSVLSAIIIED